MTTPPLTARTVTTHAAAALLGVLAALALQSQAQTSAETMLSKLPIDDLQGLRRYLEIKALDLGEYQRSTQEQIAKLEAKVSRLEQGGASRTVMAPFTVVDQQNVPIMRVSTGGGVPRGMAIYNRHGMQVAAAIEQGSLETGAVVAFNGTQQVGANGTGFGVDKDKNGFLDVQNAAGKSTFEVRRGGITAPLLVVDSDGKAILRVQAKGNEGPRSLELVSTSGVTATSLASDQQGGVIKLFNASGAAVAGLLASGNGGGLALTGPSGGKSAVNLSVDGTGGKVRVFPAAGGPAQAELTADAAGGGVTLYTKSGEPAAVLYARTTGAGQLEINQNGEKLVEAGVNANGIGLVLAGPGGTAASIPGVPDSYIIGRKLKK